jgi:hypothetical protein
VWAKISTSATAIAAAACLAAAAVTLPAVEKAGSDLAKTVDANVKLAVDLSQLAAFDAIPAYVAFLTSGNFDNLAGVSAVNALTTLFGTGGVFNGGGIDALFPDAPMTTGSASPGYDALSALDVFFGNNDGTTGGGVFTGGGIDALNNYAALSALPVFFGSKGLLTTGNIDALANYDALSAVPVFFGTNGVFTGGGVNALGGYAALSAVDTFFGDNNGEGGVFTGGGIDALAPDANGNGGYAALSALPVFFGRATTDSGKPTSFGPGLFTGGGVDALKNYAALSAIPAYVDDPTTHMAPAAVTPFAAAAQQNAGPQARTAQDPGPTTPTTGTDPVNTFVAASLPKPPTTPTTGTDPVNTFSLPKPQAFTLPAPEALTPPAPPKVDPVATPGDNSGPQLNVSRASEKFVPTKIGDNPLLFGSGTPGVDNGIRGWGDMLKKAGIGGADASSGG